MRSSERVCAIGTLMVLAGCTSPVVNVGYVTTYHSARGHDTKLEGPLVEVQSAEKGPGIFAKATSAGFGAAGLSWGWKAIEQGPWSFAITPQLGLGYLDKTNRELSTHTNFSLGMNAAIGYERARIGAGYWHLSNAGTGERNAGLDMWQLTLGWAF